MPACGASTAPCWHAELASRSYSMLLRPMQLARRPVCALTRRSGRPGQPHRPQTGRWLSTGTPPPPPPQPPPSPASLYKRFWDWTLQPRPHWRESRTEAAVIFCVFGVTGSTSVAFVRPALKHSIGLEGVHEPLQPQPQTHP